MSTTANPVKISELIAPSFRDIHIAIKRHTHTHFWQRGGRGSTKSSFTSLEIILGIMRDPDAHAVVLRKVKDTLKSSVFEQLRWAVGVLGCDEYWHSTASPLEMTYIPTGQKILFRGADDPKKIKSIKVPKGYVKFVWYEELDEFDGMEEIRNINQSLMRGGDVFAVFYTYNPPKSVQSWVNQEAQLTRDDRLIHRSNYLTVPAHWLGDQFLLEAKHLKSVNEPAYNHEYMGEITGTGGEVFGNVTIRKISNDEIAAFDQIRRGIDFGYAVDPFCYLVGHIDMKKKRLYLFYEIYLVSLSNRKAADMIKLENVSNEMIVADSAEPKSIDELIDLKLRVKGAKKGPDSVEYGIKFLQDLEAIVIDDERCPNAAREFLNYELEKDSNGNFKARFPDKNNHCIDTSRYMLEDDMKRPAFGGFFAMFDKPATETQPEQ